ncbi:hypothetical protein VTK56DRAFT_9870 [Thermocarpiscus australiensis]
MEADSASAPSATVPTTRPRQLQLSPRDPPARDPASRSEKVPRDVRLRRSPPKPGRNGERPKTGRGPGLGKPKLLASANAQTKPLLPVTEHRSHEESHAGRRGRNGSQDEDKWDLTPEGGSAGREGRQFAVANVGNNGRIYLRPTVRPAHQRYPQPHFVFPATPPSTAGLETLASEQCRDLSVGTRPDGRQRSPLSPPSSSTSLGREFSGEKQIKIRQRHRRAMSDSTVPETSVARESAPGGFKVVITQPGEEQRPRTVEDLDMSRPPMLDVTIPSWRIGSPRFSVRGTPFIRGSSYAPTEEFRSSSPSFLHRTPQEVTSRGSRQTSLLLPPGIQGPQSPPAEPSSPLGPSSPRLPHRLRSTYMSTHLVIEPAMFDALTFKPACDDRAIVRYSASGSVTAATPPRLVAEITSPSFLDYELLSDFFLTYRSFLEPLDLLRMLFARLRWALKRDDEVGLVVRVRTFVALRHWILNYFMDDFVVDYGLRVTFCDLLNEFDGELSEDLKARKVPLKILAELKKCWRRVCAQYWDGPDFDASLGPDVPISPGGIAGHRDPNLDPTFWLKSDAGLPSPDGLVAPTRPRGRTSYYADVERVGHIDAVVAGDRPATPENTLDDDELRNHAASPTSIASVDAISCSFPTKNMRFGQAGSAHPLAAHPVNPSSMYSNTEPVATTPRALVGKPARTRHSHKRSGSFSDSLRDRATITETLIYKNAEFLLALPYAGSLVRGNLFPPSQACVEVHPRSTAGAGVRQTTLIHSPPAELSKERVAASAMSGQGMKRLVGSVRRALSTKGQTPSPTQGTLVNIPALGPRGATTNRLPSNPVVPQARSRHGGARPPVRIDLLGAEIAEEFKKAVREDATEEVEKSEHASPTTAGSGALRNTLGSSAANMNIPSGSADDNADARPTSDAGITTGSKSIVIVDDTSLPENHPVMTGALPALSSSVEAFAEVFVPNGADPTPPTTPPGRPTETPRRSSHLLGHHVLRHSPSEDPLPPFIPDLDTLGLNYPHSDDHVRPSLDFTRQDSNQPLLSGVRGHTRQPSSRSYFSNRSRENARYTSFTSGTAAQPTVRSFDATTYSGQSVDDLSQVLVPQPLRVLRRKPGGDLRAVAKAGDLDPRTLRRSRSVGSLTTYTDSLHSSFLHSRVADSSGYVDVVASDCSPGRDQTFSLGAIAEQNPKRNLSLFSTHSSKPVMRPSFEAEAQKLAQIPDDLDDDGGVESALLKLEGKYKKNTGAKLSMDLSSPPRINASEAGPGEIGEGAVAKEEKEDHRHAHLVDEPQLLSPSTIHGTLPAQGSFLELPDRHERRVDVQSFLSDDSRASYASTPLLERGFTDDERSKRTITREWTDRSILQGPDEGGATPSEGRSAQNSQHPSYDFVQKTNSMEQMRPGATMPPTEPPRDSMEQSFLDVGSDNDSDLSSELSAEELDAQDRENGVFGPSDIGVAVSSLPVHPLAEDQPPSINPPSPPITLTQALHMSPEAAYIPTLQDPQIWEKPLPPTPDITSTTARPPYPVSSPVDPTGTKEALRDAPKLPIPDPITEHASASRNKYSVHLPFILAFESEVLAQQFTLVEKDALNEIDWKDLIDMGWKNAEQNGVNARSWVSFLRDTNARGVEVVIARFNIMVKWVISEVVLTQDIVERARCIVKFIHIAAHCRRYRNFATLSQVTIALTSNEVSRLTKTWAMVPASDQRTLQELETLMSPTRNFYNLRAEMEGGGPLGCAAAEMGCIPFVGIYTHDLLFNAQKPSEIASSPTTAPLVNFERCRTAAGVVKTLMRLLEASMLYKFQPVEGIIERCLWIGALPCDEIRRLSSSLE